MDFKQVIVKHCERELRDITETTEELPTEVLEYRKRYEDFLRNEIKINSIK